MKLPLNRPEESNHTQTPGRQIWCWGGVDAADLFYCTHRDEDAVYVSWCKNEFSTLRTIFLPVDVGTFAMNHRTTISDLAPKTMKSGSPGHEPGAIHLFHKRTVVTMIMWNWVAKKWKSKNLYQTKAVSQPPVAVLHANNNGVVVFLMERRVG